MVEIVANMHMHTPYSDGVLYHRDIADAASSAGLDVIIVTDHNVWVCGPAGYHGGVLVLTGEEVHDCQRDPQRSHLLIYNVSEELSPFADNPQQLINQARRRGGLTFLAHPIEFRSPLHPDLEAIGWDDWHVKHFTGLELWNYMSEFKARLWNAPAGAFPSCASQVGRITDCRRACGSDRQRRRPRHDTPTGAIAPGAVSLQPPVPLCQHPPVDRQAADP